MPSFLDLTRNSRSLQLYIFNKKTHNVVGTKANQLIRNTIVRTYAIIHLPI